MDTIKGLLYLKRGKINDNSFLFTIAKIGNDSVKAYSVNDIDGYSI